MPRGPTLSLLGSWLPVVFRGFLAVFKSPPLGEHWLYSLDISLIGPEAPAYEVARGQRTAFEYSRCLLRPGEMGDREYHPVSITDF